MHREISHTDPASSRETNFSLYLLTGLIGLLIGLDLWPAFASWATNNGWSLPAWPREFYAGYRIALIAAVLGGARVLYLSLEGILQGRIGADLALAIACVAAILFRKPLVAAEIVFIGMLGECLESFTFERTQRAIQHFVKVFPRRCWLLRDGQEIRVFTHEVRIGDRVVVKPGARIPVDGIVIEGRSAVDASALTGEALPVDKSVGDEVLAGSLNQFGALIVEARRVAEHTIVGQVIDLTARALRDKASLERTADQLARYFLPVVLGLAALTFLAALILNTGALSGTRRSLADALSLSIDPTLAVLVVACPCALILATPAAVIAALGRLAGTGVLIKGGSALERLAQVTAFAFDKTGTLTEGRLTLGEVVPLSACSADDVLRLAATAEQNSEHVLGQLLVREAVARGMVLHPVHEFQAFPGAGIMTRSPDGALVVGNRRLLSEQGIALPHDMLPTIEALELRGQTTLLVARQGVIMGVIGARDRVRPDAALVLTELRAQGIRDIALLTGDRVAVAQALAAELPLTEVHAELLPQEKADFIARWSGEISDDTSHTPRKAAMVGDGINDAPALARAAVGLAIGAGADIAAEASDVVLMGDPLRHLPLLVRLSRETVRIIRQNIIVFAFGVNGVGILLTAWLWPLLAPSLEWYEQAPLAAVIYHQLGSLAVLLNSMRLLWFERTPMHPAWRRWRVALESIDNWLEHRLDAHEAWHWLGHHRRGAAVATVLLAVAGYAIGGLVQVGPDEVAVVRRFGRALKPVLEPGLHWRLPWPMETVDRLQPDRVRTIEVGYRWAPGATTRATAQIWASSHGADGFVREADEAVMITGDGNLVELQATVNYSVDRHSLDRFLFEVRDPDEIIRATAESVLREAIAGRSFLDLLTSGREPFQKNALATLEARLQSYGEGGVGVHIDGLALHDLHPPQEVVPAYYEVTNAMEGRARQVNEAQADRIREKREAEAKSRQMIYQAKAAKEETVRAADAEQSRFLARLQARSGLGPRGEWELIAGAVTSMMAGHDSATAYNDYDRRRQQQIALNTLLTDFRLFWEALGQALTGRPKIIIDADKVPGRRQLLLFDPDQLRVPVPVIVPGDRGRARPPDPRGEIPEEGR
jgi:Cu+-exporting ATPase